MNLDLVNIISEIIFNISIICFFIGIIFKYFFNLFFWTSFFTNKENKGNINDIVKTFCNKSSLFMVLGLFGFVLYFIIISIFKK